MTREPPSKWPETSVDRQLVKSALARDLFGAADSPIRRGRFELLRTRGQGGMGVVYEAFDPKREEVVALKCLRGLEGRAITRLKREFRSLSALDHPNLVRLDALFYESGDWFFSMELVDGRPFDQYVRQSADSESRLRAALHQVIDAVETIHAAGKLHRDLKPSNVLVTRDDRVVVLDFGLVCDEPLASESPVSRSELVGTPAFVAPELLDGMPATQKSDWYAVGVMLFQALAGRYPFMGDPSSLLREKQHRDAPDPRTFASAAPRDLSELCVGLLERLPERRMTGAELRERLGAKPSSSSRTPAPHRRPFVGRASELQLLTEREARAASGKTVILCVHGASGIGKTALLDRYCDDARGRALVLRGRCHEQESVPYKVCDGVVDALAHYLAQLPSEEARALLPRHLSALVQLFPGLSTVGAVAAATAGQSVPMDAREQRNLAFVALRELLLRVTDRERVVLVVDDLHWGDIDSVRMLASVLGPPDAPPLFLLGAYRSDEVESSEFLRAFFERTIGGVACEQLALLPLPVDEAGELARRLLGAAIVDERACRAIAAESAGVPLFIAELARYLETRSSDAGMRDAHAPSLDGLIRGHVATLPQSAQRLLKVLAVAAEPLELRVAGDAAGLGSERQAVVHALRVSRLLRLRAADQDALLEIYHDRIRETLFENLSERELQTLHRTICLALERAGFTEPERLVRHYTGAGDNERAGETAFRAGVAAGQKLAFNQAVRFFKLAQQLLSPGAARALELQSHLAAALVDAGHSSAAGDAYLEAAKLAEQAQARELKALAAVQLLATPRQREGIELAREVLGSVGVQLSRRLVVVLTRLLWSQIGIGSLRLFRAGAHSGMRATRLGHLRTLGPAISWADSLRGLMVHRIYLREARKASDRMHLLTALTAEVGFLALQGGKRAERRAVQALAEMREIASAFGTPHAQALVDVADATRLLWTGRHYGDALEAANRADALLSRETGSFAWERNSISLTQLLTLEFRGELREVTRLSGEHERDARERGDQLIPMTMLSCSSLVHVLSGKPEEALELLERMRERVSVAENLLAVWVMRMTDALVYSGRAAASCELFKQEWPKLRYSFAYQGEYTRHMLRYYRARCALALYCETGDRSARSLARRMTLSLPDDASSHGAYRAALQGSLHAAEGDKERAIRLMQLSCDRFRASQSGSTALHAERWVRVWSGDAAGVAAVDEKLRAEGAVDPARWVWTYIPAPERIRR